MFYLHVYDLHSLRHLSTRVAQTEPNIYMYTLMSYKVLILEREETGKSEYPRKNSLEHRRDEHCETPHTRFGLGCKCWEGLCHSSINVQYLFFLT